MRILLCLMLWTMTAWAQTNDLTLCARVGPVRVNKGSVLSFGRHLSPAFWGFHRDVQFQICTPEGRSVSGQRQLELQIEPLSGQIGEEALVDREVTTDEQGRFSVAYGGGNRRAGPAWPEGVVSMELHHFVLDGKRISTFVVERSAGDLKLYRQ